MSASEHITEASLITWYNKQVESESIALQRLWDTYFHRMVRLARRRLVGSKREIRDEEDIALSAFQSFCRGLRRGKFSENFPDATPDDDNLWPLLVALTLNKAVDEIRRQQRLKRGGSERNADSAGELLDQLTGSEPDPQLVAVAEETMQRLMGLLDATGNEDLREIVVASFGGDSPQQIARRNGCTARTVQRKLKTARAIWESATQ